MSVCTHQIHPTNVKVGEHGTLSILHQRWSVFQMIRLNLDRQGTGLTVGQHGIYYGDLLPAQLLLNVTMFMS